MYAGLKVAAVIPCYDCTPFLEKVLRGLHGLVDIAVVVDDGSRKPVEISGKYSWVSVVRLSRNIGVGGAILKGFEMAYSKGADIAVVLAGDDQMDPADLENLITPVISGWAEVSKGDRLSHPEAFRIPWLRRLGNLALSFFTRVLSGYRDLRDSQCGYVAVDLRRLMRLPLWVLYPRYGFPNDFLVFLSAHNLRLAQVVVRPVYNGAPSGLKPVLALFTYPLILLKSLIYKIFIRFVELFSWRGDAHPHGDELLPYW